MHKGKIWELKRSSFKKKGGRRSQFPIRQGWASTIHKTQGQTCSKLGLFYPQGSSLFAPGMAYTLFSRLKSFDDFRYFAPTDREVIPSIFSMQLIFHRGQ
jgi:ATP-dependent exoDNAse (exonuclease V) alpha subunit